LYKSKTHSGAKKRFKVSAGGKIFRTRANKNHILNKKSRKRKRNLRKSGIVDKTNFGQVSRLIPYGLG